MRDVRAILAHVLMSTKKLIVIMLKRLPGSHKISVKETKLGPALLSTQGWWLCGCKQNLAPRAVCCCTADVRVVIGWDSPPGAFNTNSFPIEIKEEHNIPHLWSYELQGALSLFVQILIVIILLKFGTTCPSLHIFMLGGGVVCMYE